MKMFLIFVWWQTGANTQQITPSREHWALTSLTPPVVYHWASTSGDTKPREGRKRRQRLNTKKMLWACVHSCVWVCVSTIYLPNVPTHLLISHEQLSTLKLTTHRGSPKTCPGKLIITNRAVSVNKRHEIAGEERNNWLLEWRNRKAERRGKGDNHMSQWTGWSRVDSITCYLSFIC